MKRAVWPALALTATILVSGCAETGLSLVNPASRAEPFHQVCADLESGLVSASKVFEETLGGLGEATTSDAVPFFGAMGEIVSITLGAMLDPSLTPELGEAVREMSTAALAVQGLLTKRPPNHLEAQDAIKPAVTQLAIACFRSDSVFAKGGELFLSTVEPEITDFVDYGLQNAADPEVTLERLIIRGLEAQGIISCSSITGPNFDKPADAPIGSAMLITACTRETGGSLVIFRYEDSLDEAAHIPWLNELVAGIDNYWLLNDSGLSIANFGGTELPADFIADLFELQRVG